MQKMERILFFTISAILTVGLLTGMMGCGDDEDGEETEEARILETIPGDGSEMFSNGDLVIIFDRPVSLVWVNRISAEIPGTEATWKGQGLEAGEQTLLIQWTIGNGIISSQEITLTIKRLDTTICSRYHHEHKLTDNNANAFWIAGRDTCAPRCILIAELRL